MAHHISFLSHAWLIVLNDWQILTTKFRCTTTCRMRQSWEFRACCLLSGLSTNVKEELSCPQPTHTSLAMVHSPRLPWLSVEPPRLPRPFSQAMTPTALAHQRRLCGKDCCHGRDCLQQSAEASSSRWVGLRGKLITPVRCQHQWVVLQGKKLWGHRF